MNQNKSVLTSLKFMFTFALFIATCSCSNQTKQHSKTKQAPETITISAPVIGKINRTEQVAGSNYIQSATEYFVVAANDTSSFRPVFLKWKENGEITIDLNLPYKHATETWSQRIQELKLILKEAETDYRIDSLRTIDVGRLILTGDAAVKITKEYKNRFGDNENITTADYKKISGFLMETSLAADLNHLLQPYSISIEKFSIEKAFFTTRKDLLKFSHVEQDTIQIPDKILDCIVFVRLKRSK